MLCTSVVYIYPTSTVNHLLSSPELIFRGLFLSSLYRKTYTLSANLTFSKTDIPDNYFERMFELLSIRKTKMEYKKKENEETFPSNEWAKNIFFFTKSNRNKIKKGKHTNNAMRKFRNFQHFQHCVRWNKKSAQTKKWHI